MAMRLLNSVTATGAGPSVRLRKGILEHTAQVVITGTPTAVTVTLEASENKGVTWDTITTFPFAAGDLTAGHAMFHQVSKPVTMVRANLTVLTGGTAPTVTLRYFPFEHRGN